MPAEDYELECEAAQGYDGQSELSEGFWRTYNMMANANSGVTLLGVQMLEVQLLMLFASLPESAQLALATVQALKCDNDDSRKRTLIPLVQLRHRQAAYAATRDPRQAYTAAPGERDFFLPLKLRVQINESTTKFPKLYP